MDDVIRELVKSFAGALEFQRPVDFETFERDGNLTPHMQTLTHERTGVSSDDSPAEVGAEHLLQVAGVMVSRYGLVVVLLLIGSLKFTPAEAAGIRPLIANSPLMSWMYKLLSLQAASNLIGTTEITVAFLLALRPVFPRASFFGSLGAIATFLLTISFLFSTPGAVQFSHGFPVLGNAGQFLVKDFVLLGASIWTAAEAYRARRLPNATG